MMQNLVLRFLMKTLKVPLLMTMFLLRLRLPKKAVSLLVYNGNLLFRLLTVLSGFKWKLTTACIKLQVAEFPTLLRRCLYDQLYPNAQIPSALVSIDACPAFEGKISVFTSASAV